ncbi:putative cyclin-dependent kinase F-2 [Hordeum vulgare]|nr:putative cyclin-dependent kinase F-2 [Hordeum vulgare]
MTVVVHHDIKPGNALVAEGGEALKICDFGLGMSESQQPARQQAGTELYRAPEMLMGKPDYGAPADAWSLGCVMAELVGGDMLLRSVDTALVNMSHCPEVCSERRTTQRGRGVPAARCHDPAAETGAAQPAAQADPGGDAVRGRVRGAQVTGRRRPDPRTARDLSAAAAGGEIHSSAGQGATTDVARTKEEEHRPSASSSAGQVGARDAGPSAATAGGHPNTLQQGCQASAREEQETRSSLREPLDKRNRGRAAGWGEMP